jgi:hypothetical protein
MEAIVAIVATSAIVAIPTTGIAFVVFFKIGMFGGEFFAYAVKAFVFSV